MQLKQFQFGPIALTNTYTTNLLNPAAASGGVNAGSSGQYILLKSLYVANKTNATASFRLFLGATGANTAGTELYYDVNVPAYTTTPLYFANGLRLTTSDFLVGGASANTTLVLYGTGEVGVA